VGYRTACIEARELKAADEILESVARSCRWNFELGTAQGAFPRLATPSGPPLAPEPVSLMRGFKRVRPSAEEILDRVLNNLLTGRAPKGEQTVALDAELVLSAAEGARGGVARLDVPVFRRCPACGGTGGEWMYPCSTCDDRGVVEGEERLRVSIPPRAPDGVVIEVPLQQAGIHNLLVRLRLRVDPRL
jgi:hypothetical protein